MARRRSETLDYRGRAFACHRGHALDVHPQHLGELIVADRLERRNRLDARVVDDDVEPPERLDCCPADRPRIAADIAGGRGDALAELVEERVKPRCVPLGVDDDGRSRLVQPARDPGADVPARAGDDSDEPREVEQGIDGRDSHGRTLIV